MSRHGQREKSELLNMSVNVGNKSQLIQENIPAPINLMEDLDISQTE